MPDEPNPVVLWNPGGRDPDEIPDSEWEVILRAMVGDAYTPDLLTDPDEDDEDY